MTTFKKTNKRKLSNLVTQQLPEFVIQDHPKFAEFLSSYFLFLESAELTLTSFTAVDNILLETQGTTNSFVLLDRTDAFGLDADSKLVDEQLSFSGTFRKGEVITGSTSGATSTVLAEDFTNSKYMVSANNGWITGETVTGATSGATALVGKYRANPVENIQQLLNYSDPDHTITDFLTQMKEEFLSTIPTNTVDSLSTRKLIKNIKSLYRAKGTDKAHKAFFRMLFNETSEVYKPTIDILRVSDGKFSRQNFIRCTQTATQVVNDPIFLIGQTITQANNPASDTINTATAIVENVTKFQEGSTVVTEIEINSETTTGTFITGEILTGISYVDPETEIKVTVSQGLSTTTITNDGSTLTVGDEAALTGGAGTGARVQVLDISGAGVDEVLVDAAGSKYEIGDTVTFSSGTAEAKVAVVGGGFAPETGSIDIHVELESGTITGEGSGDLLLEDYADGTIGKFLDSASQMVEREVKIELENEVGHLLNETDGGSEASQIDYIVNQEHETDIPYNLEDDEHIVLEDNVANEGYLGDKIVQESTTVEQFEFTLEKTTLTNEGGNIALENEVGNLVNEVQNTDTGDITDIRMIASGGGYTTLPTATITVGNRFIGLETFTTRRRMSVIELEDSPDLIGDPNHLEFQRDDGNILDEEDTLVTIEGDGLGAGRIELESGGNLLDETFDGASVTLIPFGDNIGRATSLNIVEHGIDFTSAPTFLFPHYAILKTVSGTITEDETFTSNISGATGTVIDFTSPLLKYTATTSSLAIGDTVTFSGGETAVVSKSDPLTGEGTISTNISTSGKYINQDGHISELTKKVQDSLYYQDYSYVIKVSESISKWRDALKKAVHPTGFYVTGEVNIASNINAQIKQPVGASLSSGLFSGTADSPIYMRLNTLFSTIFGRRTGVGFKFMSNAAQLDGKTLVSSAVARTGIPVRVNDDFNDPNTNSEKELNLSPETTIELEQRNRNSFYSLNSYTVRGVAVENGYAYAGPSIGTLKKYALSAFASNNAITLEGNTGAGEIRLENESGVLQNDQSDSASTTIADWAQLRFSNTLNSSVDGETIRLRDIEGTNSSLNHKTNFAFPTEITKTW